MQPSNNPDIALAQEWITALEAWINTHGLTGYDPFDVKQHRIIRAAQTHAASRKVTTALCDLFPKVVRRWLQVPPTENPKAHALTALGTMRLFQLTEDQAYLEKAVNHLEWLRKHPYEGCAGLCWGYPFDVYARGVDTPRGTPVLVVSVIAGEAFLQAYELTKQERHFEAARSIAAFLLHDIPRIEQPDGTFCFGYTPQDRRRVHNANLLAAEHLFRVWAVTGERELAEAAESALRFTLARQREDGAWHYGEFSAEEPYDAGNLRMIDNHHTGFVLRSLHGIQQARPDDNVLEAMRKGFRFYRTLFTPAGMPRTAHGRYPVDIHACVEGILCPSMLSESVAGGKELATRVMRWTHFYLRDRATSVPYYRKYPGFTSRVVFPRWGVAWLYRGLAEYLFRFCR